MPDIPYYLVKVTLVGASGVGKTCLRQAFRLAAELATCNSSSLLGGSDNKSALDASLAGHILTIGVDFDIFRMSYPDGNHVKFQLWDTGGHQRFRSIIPSYYAGTSIVLLVFDVTNQASFDELNTFLDVLRTQPNFDSINLVLVGTKSDLVRDRVVSVDRARSWISEQNLPIDYIEVSAKEPDELKDRLLPFLYHIISQLIEKGQLSLKTQEIVPLKDMGAPKISKPWFSWGSHADKQSSSSSSSSDPKQKTDGFRPFSFFSSLFSPDSRSNTASSSSPIDTSIQPNGIGLPSAQSFVSIPVPPPFDLPTGFMSSSLSLEPPHSPHVHSFPPLLGGQPGNAHSLSLLGTSLDDVHLASAVLSEAADPVDSVNQDLRTIYAHLAPSSSWLSMFTSDRADLEGTVDSAISEQQAQANPAPRIVAAQRISQKLEQLQQQEQGLVLFLQNFKTRYKRQYESETLVLVSDMARFAFSYETLAPEAIKSKVIEILCHAEISPRSRTAQVMATMERTDTSSHTP